MRFVWKHTQPEFEHPVSNIHSKYLCSHYTVKVSSYFEIWESHLEKSSLLTYVPLVDKLANKLSTVNYALIQVPMWCVPVWIHLHMSGICMHMNISVSPFSLPPFHIGTASLTTAMLLLRQWVPPSVAGLGILAFFPLFLIIPVKRLSPWYPLPKLPLTDFGTNPALLVHVRVLNEPS